MVPFKGRMEQIEDEEIQGFPAFVAGLDPPPSVVFLDENLDHSNGSGAFLKGTQLVPRLREAGFAGKIVIKSANQASSERARHRASGADG